MWPAGWASGPGSELVTVSVGGSLPCALSSVCLTAWLTMTCGGAVEAVGIRGRASRRTVLRLGACEQGV
eukprot:5948178-Prymnesium_polylepis.1